MAEKILTQALAFLPEIILLIDPEFSIIWANKETHKLFKSADLRGRRCFEVLHGKPAPPKRCPAKIAMATGKTCRGLLHTRTLGTLYVSVAPVFSEETKEIKALWLMGVRLGSPEAKEALGSYRFEIIGRLATGFVHDIKNLLSYLLGELEILELLSSDDRLKHRYRKMRVVLESISTLSRKLSSLGDLRKEAELLNINRVLEDLHPLIKLFVPEGVSYEVEHDPALKPVRFNRAVLEQILLNLVMNAVEALPAKGGLIRVQTKDAGDGALLIVEDNGVGIKEELQDLVFEPFFTTKESGSGLGLSLIKEWVEEVGGEISLESREGQGTKFIIRFPVPKSLQETR